MIVSDKSKWFGMLFAVRGSSLNTIWPRMLIVTIFSMLVTFVYAHYSFDKNYTLTATPFALIGTALAIFLGFRNNEAYSRYWEGRTLWGRMVNVSRSLTRQCLTIIVAPKYTDASRVEQTQKHIVRMLIAYVHSFRHHLRDSNPDTDLERFLSEAEVANAKRHQNVPVGVLQIIAEKIQEAWQAGFVHTLHMPILESSLTEIMSVQGGCERIKNTPIPFTYNVLIHRVVTFYCFAMPFGIADTVHWLTPVVVFMISYAFFGLDAIGDEVEQPFELDDNDLPLNALSTTIEINLLQLIGETELPDPEPVVDGVLF